jgi:hypothetical protein
VYQEPSFFFFFFLLSFSHSDHFHTTKMDAGTNQMYAIQRPAYEARSQLVGRPTDSTPDTPPSHPPLDVVGLCNLRKSIVENLPTTCSHCGAEFPKGSIVELKGGEIIAYCKKLGACGKSQVLFAAVDFRTPVYKKVCVYSRGLPAVIPPPQQSGVPSSAQTTTPPGPIIHADPRANMSQMTHQQLMQMHCPSCVHCGLDEAHHSRCDQNGWSIASYNTISYPSDWPYYNPSTGTWGTSWIPGYFHSVKDSMMNK